MQLLINRSKHLIAILLSCNLLFSWYGSSNNDGVNLRYTSIKEPQMASTDDSIWNSIGRNLKLDHKTETAAVQAEIHRILLDRNKLYSILSAAAPYIYFIHQQTQEHHLPGEIALIPVLESEFNPNDRSIKGATGLWQLMPQTAHELGVKIRSGYDGRRNVVDSTKAALAYFNDLGNQFQGNWYLAIAAYNCGQVTIQHAIRRAGSHDFWRLRLPKETKIYVPKLLAIAEIIKNPEKYGVELPPIHNEPYFTEMTIKKPVSLNQVAKSSGINIKELHQLNPDLHGTVLPKGNHASLLVPIRKASVVKAQVT